MRSALRPLTLPVLLAVFLLPAAVARADEPATKPNEPVSYSFDDDEVLGNTVAPYGEVMNVRKRGQRASLVRARGSFVVELLHSVEAL